MTRTPHVLFLVVDSARKDRVSAYGHHRETTPQLDALASSSTVYETAYASAPWTLPSHCSMFTGRCPSEHGVTDGFADSVSALPTDLPTITQRLTDRGYRTAGFSNNPWVGTLSGLDRGFDEYVEWDLEIAHSEFDGIHDRWDRLESRLHTLLGQGARQPVFAIKRRFFTDRLVARAKRWLTRGAKAGQPTFTFLNLMEAHSPYFPPQSAFEALDLESPSLFEPRLLNTKLLAYVLGKHDLEPDERRRILEYYDASLRYQDRKVGELLDILHRNDVFDDTLLIVCADHGKTLGDYDRTETPPHYTRRINVNVPLIVNDPDQTTGHRETRPVELRSIYDRIVDGAFPDNDLLAGPTGEGIALVEDFVPHSGKQMPDSLDHWRVVVDRECKYVTDGQGSEYLFDVSEGRDRCLSDPSRQRLRKYREALAERVDQFEETAASERDSQRIGRSTQSQLRDLGYM